RASIAKQYSDAFRRHPTIEPPVSPHAGDICAWYLYIIRLNLDRLTIDRNQFMQELNSRGIGCSVHFIPLHMQPYWRDRYGLASSMFPVASSEFFRVISLPIYPDMTDSTVNCVIDAVTDVALTYKR